MDQAHREQYRESFTEFKKRGTAFQGRLKNIIDIPYFAGRLDTRMIQLADFTAHAVFRYYNHQDASYFQQILPRFDRRDPLHPPDGLKHYTREVCSCEACKWRL